MKIYNQPRGTGKTTRLIYASEYDNIPILCGDGFQKNYIISLAKSQGVNIPEPITVKEFKSKPEGFYKKVLIDEVLRVLQLFLGQTDVAACTICEDDTIKSGVTAENDKAEKNDKIEKDNKIKNKLSEEEIIFNIIEELLRGGMQ